MVFWYVLFLNCVTMEFVLWKILVISFYSCMLDLVNVSLLEYDVVICLSFFCIVSLCCLMILLFEVLFMFLVLCFVCIVVNFSGVYFFEVINLCLKVFCDLCMMYGVSLMYRCFFVFGGGFVILVFLLFLFNLRRLYTLVWIFSSCLRLRFFWCLSDLVDRLMVFLCWILYFYILSYFLSDIIVWLLRMILMWWFYFFGFFILMWVLNRDFSWYIGFWLLLMYVWYRYLICCVCMWYVLDIFLYMMFIIVGKLLGMCVRTAFSFFDFSSFEFFMYGALLLSVMCWLILLFLNFWGIEYIENVVLGFFWYVYMLVLLVDNFFVKFWGTRRYFSYDGFSYCI